MTHTITLKGHEAITFAEANGLLVDKHADPTEGARLDVPLAEAREIAAQDPGLIYLTVEAEEYVWRTDAVSGRVVAASLDHAVELLVAEREWPTSAQVADGGWGWVEAPDGERVTIGQVP